MRRPTPAAAAAAGEADDGAAQSAAATAPRRFGAAEAWALPPGALGEVQGDLHISPNEVMFVRAATRTGVLPRMLTEILEARFKVKRDMKRSAKAGGEGGASGRPRGCQWARACLWQPSYRGLKLAQRLPAWCLSRLPL